ncbi:MAG TPA: DUF3106 domain-containing protein [Terriglobales bacterium]|nr:DUF3106 domain-containing protein [Terriglobales bacterium]
MASGTLALCLATCPAALGQARQNGPKGGKHAEKPPKAKQPKGGKNAETPIDEFMRMSPEERQKALNRLPPAQRKRLQERLQRFNQLPPGEQQTLKGMYNRLNQLPAERQQVVRRSLNQFTEQPGDSKQAIRQELKSLGQMSPQERDARMASPEFRARFSQNEQGIIRNMSELLPPR